MLAEPPEDLSAENLQKNLLEILCPQNLQKNVYILLPTCVVAVVGGEEDVGVVQMALRLQRLHDPFHQVVH